MTKKSLRSIMVLCAALAACTDGKTSQTLTAPNARASSSETPAGGVGFTADGALDVAITSEEAPMQMAAQAAAAAQGTRSRSSGHVGFNFSSPIGGVIASQQYSFTAAGTSTAPTFTANGEYEMTLTTATGRTNKVHGNVLCMSTTGNTTRIAGQITKLWINNIPTPVGAATHNIWTVTDTGEGQGNADQVSLMLFTTAPFAQNHCAVGLTPPVFSNQEGNIQVQ